MRELRYIWLLLVVGLYASVQSSDMSMPATAACPSASESSLPSALHNTLEDYAKRLQQQYDWTDALTSSYQLSSNNQENRLRTRRHERLTTSWQLRTSEHQQHAALLRQTSSISHIINRIVAISSIVPLSLPAEQISFPFHSFW